MPPKCPSCSNTTFALAHPIGGVSGAVYKMPFVVCAKCQCAIAVLSQTDPGIAAQSALNEIVAIRKQVDQLEGVLGHISTQLASIVRK